MLFNLVKATTAISFLLITAACNQQTEKEIFDQKLESINADLAASEAKVARINEVIAWSESKNLENPAKMQRLINECALETGEPMEGEGAIINMNCARGKW